MAAEKKNNYTFVSIKFIVLNFKLNDYEKYREQRGEETHKCGT